MGVLPHLIWAFVALCAIGAVFYLVWSNRVRAAYYLGLQDMRNSNAVFGRELLELKEAFKDVEVIRKELEKLKAIPPKAPRF